MKEQVYYQGLVEALDGGLQLVQATVVKTFGSCPAQVGKKALFSPAGLVCGTVGGGALELTTQKKAISMIEKKELTAFEHFVLGADLGMICGGEADVFFELVTNKSWRIVIFGAGHVAIAVVDCLRKLDCEIVCIDHRQEWLDRIAFDKNVKTVLCQKYEDYVTSLTAEDFVVIMTPGHEFDFSVVDAILKRITLPYVAVIGSKRKATEMRTRLKEYGFSEVEIDSIICPAGLPIGNNKPEEIAISLIAQLLQKRDEYYGTK
ncbi:MAG: XdhC family protein [Negativicutes bacterium]|jgi:xanthine dehydrogenase accessory factor